MTRPMRTINDGRPNLRWIGRSLLWAATLGAAAACSGCISTSWRHVDRYPLAVQTILVATSNPTAEVFLDGQSIGLTPLRVPLRYEATVERSRRDVTLWKSEPSLAVALTLMSGGAYLPSSLFPVASENQVETEGYRDNSFRLRLEAPGLPAWDSTLELEGQPEHTLDVDLQALAAPVEPAP